MNFIALDQSTSNVGWAIFKDGCLYSCGLLNLKKIDGRTDTEGHAFRRHYFAKFLAELVAQEEIEHIVYEGIFNSQNMETVVKLAKLQGSVEDTGVNCKVTFEEIRVNTWRAKLPLKCASRKRADMKKAVCDYVDSVEPSYKGETEDTKEAIAIGLAYIKMMGRVF